MKQFKLILTRRFAPLFATQFLGAFNDNVFKNSLVILIAFSLADQSENNSSILVIIAAGLFILPFFLFSALAGQFADKFEKSRLIQRIKLAEICIMLLAGLGFLLASPWLLMLVLFLMGTQSTLFGPLKYGILPQHLDESELTGGNGMIQMGTYAAILLGTILGGVLIAIKPEGRTIVSVLVLIVAFLGYLVSRRIPVAAPTDPGLTMNWNIARETLNIIHSARENRVVFWSIITISWCWFYGATLLSLIPSYTRDILSGNEHVATLLLTAFSIGIGTGSLLCEKLSRSNHIEMGLMPLGATGLSLFALDLYIVGIPAYAEPVSMVTAGMFLQQVSSWRVLLDVSLMGMFGGVLIVPLYALIQNLSKPSHRSRIIAANNILNALFMVGSAVMTISLIAMYITLPTIFLVISLLNILVILLVVYKVPEFFKACLEWLGKF